MSRYVVTHVTRYEYETEVVHAHHIAHLRPRALPWQAVANVSLRVEPAPIFCRTFADFYGNSSDWIEVFAPHDLLQVEAKSEVTLEPRALEGVADSVSVSWEKAAEQLAARLDLVQERDLCFDSALVRSSRLLREYAKETFTPGKPLVLAVLEFNQKMHREFSYDSTVTDVSTPVLRVLRERRGVCQDFAHVAIGCLRSLGLAARYVSGYLETLPPPGRPRLVGADASHAWASVFVPDFGWLDFDPTNGSLPDQQHITVAWGRDFADVSPFKGVVLGGGSHRISVGVDVARQPVSPEATP